MDPTFAWPTTFSAWLALGLAVFVGLVGLVDVWLAVVHGQAATVSAVVREQSLRYPAIPLAVGLLVGHLFL